jgi:carboxyl-terminal processing protease
MQRLVTRTILTATVVFMLLITSTFANAGQSIELSRADMRRVVDILATDIEKKFYDPSLNGVDIKKLAEETKAQISGMNDVGQMHAAVWEFVRAVGDSHTRYVPPQLTVFPTFGFKARGVGDDVLVTDVIKDGPAEKAGVKPGDKLLALNGMRVTRDNISDVLYFYRRLRPVRLLVVDYVRDGAQARLQLEPTFRTETSLRRIDDISGYYRDRIEAENNAAQNPFVYGTVNGVGYVKLRSFSGTLPEEVMWKIKDAKAVIVDLRGNPGGNTEVLKDMTGFFDRQNTPIADMVGRKKTEKLVSKPQRVNFDGPLVILVDSGSASASEIFAYHLQRIGRAIVMGDKTMGAVSAANYLQEHAGNYALDFGLMLTTDKVVFPDGKSIEKLGVTPDVMCLPKPADMAAGKDACLGRAAEIANEKLAKGNAVAAAAK